MKISELKKEAKIKLTEKWPLALGINFISLVVTISLTFVATKIQGIVGAILALISGIIYIPLSYGLTASMLKLSRNEIVGVTDFITIGFKNFKKAILLSLSIFIRILIPIIILIFVSVLGIISNFANTAGIFLIISSILSIGAIIWLISKVLSYALSTYVLIDNENIKCKAVIAKSCELMKGNKLKFVGLVFSFFGWILLCGILGGIAETFNETLGTIVSYGLSLVLTPYITFTEINFYEELAGISVNKVEIPEDSSDKQ